jgi:hypothetical protein
MTITGMPRFTDYSVNNIKKIIESFKNNNYSLEICCVFYNRYKNNFRLKYFNEQLNDNIKWIEYYDESEISFINNSPFLPIQHGDKIKYSYQYFLYSYIFKKLNTDYDLYLKYRSDIFSDNEFPVNQLLADHINMPAIEGHCDSPFDPNRLLNDQIWIGNYKIMNSIMNIYDNLKLHNIHNLNEKHKYSTPYGIEGIIQEYVFDNNIKLNLFDYRYKLDPNRVRYDYE